MQNVKDSSISAEEQAMERKDQTGTQSDANLESDVMANITNPDFDPIKQVRTLQRFIKQKN